MALKDKKEGGLRLINASWVWTEPHSKRLKIRLSVQRQVMHGAILQQVYFMMVAALLVTTTANIIATLLLYIRALLLNMLSGINSAPIVQQYTRIRWD